MISVPLFKSVSRTSVIFCFISLVGYGSFVHYTFGEAVATEGARHFSAVAVFFFWLVFFCNGYFGVVLLNYGSHVGGAAVAEFDGFSVENFVEWVVAVEMFVDKSEEAFSNVCFEVGCIRGVEPCDFALAFFLSVLVLFLVLVFFYLLEFEFGVVSAFFQGFLVLLFAVVEVFLTAGKFAQPLIDYCRYSFDYIRGVV